MATAMKIVVDPSELWAGINYAKEKDGVWVDARTFNWILEAALETFAANEHVEFDDAVGPAIRRFVQNLSSERFLAYYHGIAKSLNHRRKRIELELLRDEAWETIFRERRETRFNKEHLERMKPFGLDVVLDESDLDMGYDLAA